MFLKFSQVKQRRTRSITRTPTQPTDAASVGVAIPPKMEPRTRIMRIIGAITPLELISISLKLARSSLGIAGAQSFCIAERINMYRQKSREMAIPAKTPPANV